MKSTAFDPGLSWFLKREWLRIRTLLEYIQQDLRLKLEESLSQRVCSTDYFQWFLPSPWTKHWYNKLFPYPVGRTAKTISLPEANSTLKSNHLFEHHRSHSLQTRANISYVMPLWQGNSQWECSVTGLTGFQKPIFKRRGGSPFFSLPSRLVPVSPALHVARSLLEENSGTVCSLELTRGRYLRQRSHERSHAWDIITCSRGKREY